MTLTILSHTDDIIKYKKINVYFHDSLTI